MFKSFFPKPGPFFLSAFIWALLAVIFWQAGGGIVHDSDAALEWKEVCNKSAIMRLVLEESDDHVPAHR